MYWRISEYAANDCTIVAVVNGELRNKNQGYTNFNFSFGYLRLTLAANEALDDL